jgi:DeoR/GlpR family transcriptional regulator of sugar metabolism
MWEQRVLRWDCCGLVASGPLVYAAVTQDAAWGRARMRPAEHIAFADPTKRKASAHACRICAVQEMDMLITNDQTTEQEAAAFEAAGVEVRRG